MSFFQLVRREMHGSLNRLAVMSGLGGVSNAAILAAINSGAQAAGNGEVSVSSAALFVVALLLFIKTQHYILIATTVEIEAIIHKLRVRLMDEVRHSELLPLDEIGRAAIVAAITKETATLTQATNMVAFAGQGVVLVFFVGIYIAYLSLLAFAVSVVVISVAGVIFHFKSRQVAAGTREAAEWDNRLFDRLIDLLDGFKEVRLNRSRSDDLFDDVVEVSRKAANIKIRSQSESLQAAGFLAEFDVPASRRRRVCGAGFQRHQRRFDHAGHNGSHVRRRSVHGYRANDTCIAGRGCCIGQYRAAGGEVAGNRRRRAGRHPRASPALRQDRDAQCRVQLQGQIIRSRLSGGPPEFHLALRRPCLHQRRQRFRQVHISQIALWPVRARFRRNPA